MLQTLLVRVGQEFSTLALLTQLCQLESRSKISVQKAFSSSFGILTCRLIFQELVCLASISRNSSCTNWSCHRQHKLSWRKKPVLHPLVAASQSGCCKSSASSLWGLISSPVSYHQVREGRNVLPSPFLAPPEILYPPHPQGKFITLNVPLKAEFLALKM